MVESFLLLLTLAQNGGIELGEFRISGRFDVNLEIREFESDPLVGKFSLINYHHFIFVSRVSRKDPLLFSAELIDLTYYEIGLRISDFIVKGGKILVPFGADPLYHHEYGGLVGFDQKFVPVIWAEHGGYVGYTKTLGETLLSNEIYLINVPEGNPTKPFKMNLKASPSRFGLGDRIRFGYKFVNLYLSGLAFRYAPGHSSYLIGGDIGLMRLPGALERLSLKMGIAYNYVAGDPQKMGKYFNASDYIRADIKITDNLIFRYIVGASTFQNYSGIFYDKENKTSDDATAHNFALIYKYKYITGLLQYVLNIEAKEIKNDFTRFAIFLEF